MFTRFSSLLSVVAVVSSFGFSRLARRLTGGAGGGGSFGDIGHERDQFSPKQ